MTNWTELKRLAEEATQGDWERDGSEVGPVWDQNASIAKCSKREDAAFIAAANPKTILALIAENEALRKRARIAEREAGNSLSMLKGLEKVARVVDANSDYVSGENNKLRAEVDALLRQVDTLTEWYANGLNVIEECSAVLPGAYYMDPPDGGDVTVPEQLRRMAKDAKRYRHLKDQGHFRAMSIDMGGNHSWMGMGRHVGKGVTVDDAIDAEIARTRQ